MFLQTFSFAGLRIGLSSCPLVRKGRRTVRQCHDSAPSMVKEQRLSTVQRKCQLVLPKSCLACRSCRGHISRRVASCGSSALLMEDQTTVDNDELPGDVPAFLARQENRRTYQIFRICCPLETPHRHLYVLNGRMALRLPGHLIPTG
jgi:hypothetical protein